MSNNLMKYIMFGDMPVIFDSRMSHSEISETLLKNPYLKLREPSTAGFIKVDELGISVYGDSITLGLKSSPDDVEFIADLMS